MGVPTEGLRSRRSDMIDSENKDKNRKMTERKRKEGRAVRPGDTRRGLSELGQREGNEGKRERGKGKCKGATSPVIILSYKVCIMSPQVA